MRVQAGVMVAGARRAFSAVFTANSAIFACLAPPPRHRDPTPRHPRLPNELRRMLGFSDDGGLSK